MNLQYRIDLLVRLGEYILSDEEQWLNSKEKASYENGWFIPEFVDHACRQIATNYLQRDLLKQWTTALSNTKHQTPKTIGIVMAGNIPLVGFHDWLSVFISGNKAMIKPSSKDQVLIKHLVNRIAEMDTEAGAMTDFGEMLKGCDAYIATGSNNSSRYFEYYFGKYPHIIRRNKTSVAILSGNETIEELGKLAYDVYFYFGLGCRNVTKIYIPEGYDFVPLLETFKKYNWLADHHKYKNNYDYNLAILLLNRKYYMTNGSVLLTEEASLFSPISVLHYEFYPEIGSLEKSLVKNADLQCITGHGKLPFGATQSPSLEDYADGINTLSFLAGL